MDLICYQDEGVEMGVARRVSVRDRAETTIRLDDDLNIVASPTVTKAFYVGGMQRGYGFRIKFTRADLLQLLKEVADEEERSAERISQVMADLKKVRERRIIEEHQRQIALALRRERDATRRKLAARTNSKTPKAT